MNRIGPIAAAAALFAAGSAQAVTQTAGYLEIDDANDKATIDIQFFTVSSVEDIEFQFDIRDFLDQPMTDTLAARLWSVDGAGNLVAALASADNGGMGSFHMDRFGADRLAIGNYAFVVGTLNLAMTEFPPFQVDAGTPAGIPFVEYEISTTTGQHALAYTCILEGNLDGTVTQTGAGPCQLPQAAAEPGTLAAMGGGLALAGLVAVRRRMT
ncbi:MAG: hypothetical protein KDC18_11310 [Alphaproteobacteria bacterium]|nr:hypothetical protein [Alphaproteobacteria bacterium]MCB9928293.1 hypothetical protein [Alphaproteobacteria bacterium]